jgi:hypothetical protein
MTATFSEPIDTTTIGASTFTLRDSSNNAVAAVVSYDSASRTATLDPTASLAPGMTYTARVRGGSTDPRVKDVVGNALAADFVWTFSIPSDTTPPVVTTLVPAASASGVSVSTTVRATFSESMDGSTINGNTFTLRTSANALVAATVTYDAATATAILTPTAPLTPSAVFTATVKGGSTDPRVKDAAGNALSADASWSFTTQSAAPSGCPCTIWPSTATPAGIDSGDSDAVELGVKFQSDADGFITGIRFYKAASNGGTHVGHLWTSAGTLLATVTFANETASGWQQANLTTPVAITANTVYVVSYFAPQGHYSYTGANFQSAVHNPPLHALANSAGGNGVFRYGSTGFPNQSWNATNYWVDVVYGTSATGGDTTAPSVSSVSPVNGGTGIGINTTITATFSEVLDATTVSTNTLEVRNPSNALVPVSVSWDAAARMAILQPTAPLAYSTQYTVRVKGGAVDPRVKDAAGNAMASDFVWSFTTGAAAGQSPSEGPGGPVLVVTGASNPGGAYYAEILRAEGLNAFSVMDITSVTTGVLAAYDVVILSEIPLSAAQVTMFSGWAQAGGNLIAMRPDKQLAGLLGLTDLGTTLSDKYLLVDTLTGPGKGIVAETMQFHGTADRYGLNGATTVATLYSASATPTTSPAVTMRALPGGGTVAAFAYDLAKSVVYTRQGNPAWSGQDRDGQAPVRSNDLFFGASASDPQADWIDFNKVHIPQADEQQRLLANMILTMNLSRKPLPRFWYLPRGLKAAIVMTGDDHNGGGTIGRFDSEKIVSPAGCSVENWECVRSTSYIYATAPLTTAPADAAAYTLQGFDIAAHLNTQCQNFTAASLATVFTSQLTAFQSAYPGAGVPKTNRMHCIVWSDYDTLPQVSFANGIRLDTTYYYWPGTWVQNRPGLFTGSGLPMRFARANGTLVDVYQAPTQLSDESAIDYTLHTNTLLDRALGPEGFYGTFVANMHTDVTTHLGWQAIIASVQSRGVPVISAKQLLTWLDARNGSSFGQLTWTPAPVGPQGGHTLSFTLTPGANSTGLQAMLPLTLTGGAGRLVLLQRDGVGTSFEVKTVKGIQYAVFAAAAGNYSAIYDTTAPVTTFSATPSSLTNSNSATFVFSANEAGSTFECSLDAAAYASCASPQTLNGLATGAHTFAVRATDTAGNSGTASNSWTVDQAPPTISSRTPSPGATGAPLTGSVTVVFNEAVLAVSDATFQIQRVGSATPLAAIITATGNTAVLKPVAPLLIGAAYTVTVGAGVTDAAGNALGSDSVWSFTATGAIADSTAAEFTAGTVDANARITQVAGGEVVLGPSVGSEFNDAALPAGWTTTQWTTGGAASVSGGALNVNGVRTGSTATYSPGRSLEFVATFGADNYQHVGFGDTFESTPWAIFSTAGGGGLYARTHNGVNQVTTLIPGSWLGTSHRFRIDWGTSTVVYSIDGSQVASHSIAIAVNMRPIASDYITGGSSLVVDWLWLSRPYTVSAVFTSRVIDAAAPANWTSVGVTADLPSGTAIAMSVRMGNTATPDGSWTAWTTVPAGGSISGSSRYIQYRATLSTTDPNQTPTLRDVTLTGSTQ